jgi:hypothetical protein
LIVDLNKEGKRKTRYIHRLVAEAFVENPTASLEVDHINRITIDNRAENLRWATRKQQLRNTVRNIEVEINGERMTLTDVAIKYDINVNTLQYRYYRGDRGERLIRKVDLENYDVGRKAVSNTGITGISRRKSGSFLVDVTYKKKRYSASAKTLEEAIAKKEEIIKSIEGGNLNV